MRQITLFYLLLVLSGACSHYQEPSAWFAMRTNLYKLRSELNDLSDLVRNTDKSTLRKLFSENVVHKFTQANILIRGLDKVTNRFDKVRASTHANQIKFYLIYHKALIKKLESIGVSTAKIKAQNNEKVWEYFSQNQYVRSLSDEILSNIYYTTDIALRELLGENIYILEKYLKKQTEYKPYYHKNKQIVALGEEVELSVGLRFVIPKETEKNLSAACKDCWVENKDSKDDMTIGLEIHTLGQQNIPIHVVYGSKDTVLHKEILVIK